MIFEYKVRCRHKLGWKDFNLYADTDIEEFFNRNSIDYVRNMTDTVEHRQLKEIENLTNDLEREKSQVKEYGTRLLKAIEYIETHQLNFKKNTTTFGSERLSMEERKLLDILRGVDKE